MGKSFLNPVLKPLKQGKFGEHCVKHGTIHFYFFCMHENRAEGELFTS